VVIVAKAVADIALMVSIKNIDYSKKHKKIK
jgi:hypothetical protein